MNETQCDMSASPFGSVPADWRVFPLSELTSLMTNGFVGTATTHYVDAAGVTYIQGFNVIDGGFNLYRIKHVSQEFHNQHQKSRLRAGDLLTIQTGDIGLSTVVSPALAGSNCHALIVSRFKSELADSRYYMRLFNSEAGRQVLRSIETGSTMKHLNVGDMLKLMVPLPPLEEQVAIANILESASESISSLERLIAKKQAIKQGMMQQLLTGHTRLPGFVSPWVAVRLGDVGGTYGGLTGKSKADFGNGSAVFVTFMEVMAGARLRGTRLERVNVGPAERQNRVAKGDVLFNGSSETPEELALAAVVDYDPSPRTYLNSFCFGYRLKSHDQIDPTYLAHFFRSSQGRDLVSVLAQGATRYNIAKTKLIQVAPILPAIEEQRAVVSVLGDIEAEMSVLDARLSKARDIKAGMMQQLLTGRTRLPVEGAV